jgi:DNA-binding XRE family transcriptional regulator
METKKKLTKKEAIVAYMNNKDLRVSTIAAEAGVSPQRLYQWLKEEGIKPDRRSSPQQKKPRYTPRAGVEWTARGIKALRTHMGLTQRGLAEFLGVRQQTISEWETNAYKPRLSMSKYLTMVAERAGFVYQVEPEET